MPGQRRFHRPPARAGAERRPRHERGRGSAAGGAAGDAPGGVLYGINSVEGALRAQRRTLQALHVKDGAVSPGLALLIELAEARDVPVRTEPQAELDALAHSSQHQGAVLRCGPLPTLDDHAALDLATRWRDAGAAAADTLPPLLLALDQVEDPRNLGAVARAGAAFGAAGLVLPRDHSAPLSAVAISASAGTLERLPVHKVANLARFLEQAGRAGFWIIGAAAEGGEPIAGYTHDRPLVLVLGNEGRGLRQLVARGCDQLVTIPLPGAEPGVGLNVASAAAVLLYQLMTYR